MSTIPQVQSLFDSLPHASKSALICDMYGGAPSFDPYSRADADLSYIVSEWLNRGNVAPDALALRCAQWIASNAAQPVAPPPLAAVPAQPQSAPQSMPSPSGIAPQAVTPAPQPAPQPVARPVAAVVLTPQPVPFNDAAMPRMRGAVPARSLFADQPTSVVDRIPAGLMLEYYADPSAPPVDAAYAFDGRNLAASLGALAANENMWLFGPRGTGKTEFARQVAARTGRPFFRVNFNRSTDAEDILGSLGISGGDTRFVYGPVSQAVQIEGAILLLDELTYAVASHIACLNPVLEKNGERVRMPRTGEQLTVASGVVAIVADNTAGNGATSNEVVGRTHLSADILDRFQLFLAFDYMPADMERRVLRAMVKRACGVKPSSDLARSVCKLVAVCRAKADCGELEGAPSLRRAVALCVALTQGFDAAESFVNCVVNPAPADSQEALRQIFAATWAHGGAQPAVDPNANPFAAEPV